MSDKVRFIQVTSAEIRLVKVRTVYVRVGEFNFCLDSLCKVCSC
jgi:hypothetical protein